MLNHLRGNLWLLGLTLVLCSGVYPLTLWAIAQTIFKDQAQGSLILKDGKVIGSRLIAQPFTGDEFFQPRPSAASYNGAASSGSNLGPNNYKLRDRVARQLGPIVRYGKGIDAIRMDRKPGDGVQDDLEAWFQKDRYQKKPGILAQWAGLHGGLAEAWVNSIGDAVKGQWKKDDKDADPNVAFYQQWQTDLPDLFKEWTGSSAHADWKKANADADAPSNADLIKAFLETFSRSYPGEWPTLEEFEKDDKEKAKRLVRVNKGGEIQSVFFDMWRQDNADLPLEAVPADMVMTSGSGLDPHITLDNANYQLRHRVAGAQANKLVAAAAEPALKARGDKISDAERTTILADARKKIEARIGSDLEAALRVEIDNILTKHRQAPLYGLVGVPLVNVLDVNLAVQESMGRFATKAVK